MTLKEYFQKYNISRFADDPHLYNITPDLADIIDYQQAEIDLKIHTAKVILCRNFHFSEGIFGQDAKWFIKSFFLDYERDLLKPWITITIQEAVSMVLSDETFTKNVIGTVFLFGVVEFYAKHNLGYRPEEADFFDVDYHLPFRRMTLEKAMNRVKSSDTDIAASIKDIDSYFENLLIKRKMTKGRWIVPCIAERLTQARNTMLHGENHSFYSFGQYLLMLYALFHLHQMKIIDKN